MLRTEDQAWAFRVALQTLGDLCGFGINYFDLENVGYVKPATRAGDGGHGRPLRAASTEAGGVEGPETGVRRATCRP